MNVEYYLIFLLVSFFASVIGAICGIGGGVLMKPLLDACGVLEVDDISFLSGLTVLSMSCYSVLKAKYSGKIWIEPKISTFLGVGAAFGGVCGKALFQYLIHFWGNSNRVGAVQASALFCVTLGTLIYTIQKDKIKTIRVNNGAACIAIGLLLGLISSFLGIGGGPINLVVLFYFFSMSMKTAAQNSLYIIFISQLTSVIHTFVSHSVPDVELGLVGLMVVSGILGGAAGRKVNRKMEEQKVNRLFIFLLYGIMIICVYNTIRFIC